MHLLVKEILVDPNSFYYNNPILNFCYIRSTVLELENTTMNRIDKSHCRHEDFFLVMRCTIKKSNVINRKNAKMKMIARYSGPYP